MIDRGTLGGFTRDGDKPIDDTVGPPELKPGYDDWYYVVGGEKKGPISAVRIKLLLNTNEIAPDTFVWRKGMKDWCTIRDSELYAFVDSEPPPFTGEQINNSVVWMIAFLPLLLGLINIYYASQPDQILSQALGRSLGVDYSPKEVPVIVPLALYSLLGFGDERRLSKAGYSGGWITGFAIILTPVYLFVRAKKLKQRPTYAITWVVIFFLSIMLVGAARS